MKAGTMSVSDPVALAARKTATTSSVSEEPTICAGQLRRWLRPDYEKDLHKPFVIIGEEWDRSETELCWRLLIDGREDWHFADVIEKDSEVIDGVS